MSLTSHSYVSQSWRGSWPRYVCVYCGTDSRSDEARRPCPGETPIASPWERPTPTPTDDA